LNKQHLDEKKVKSQAELLKAKAAEAKARGDNAAALQYLAAAAIPEKDWADAKEGRLQY